MPLPLVYRDFGHPRIEVKSTWNSSWEEVEYLQVLSAGNFVPSVGIDYASFRSRYGRVKLPGSSSIETADPYDLQGKWVRVSVPTEFDDEGSPIGDFFVLFVGRFDSQVRSPHGKTIENPPSGVQEWTAYGGYQILMKAGVNSHFAEVAGDAVEMRWVSGVNTWRGKAYDKLGNRSSVPFNDPLPHYCFYGQGADRELWDSLEFAKYLLAKYLPNWTSGVHPSWSIVGQTDAIQSITEPVEFGGVTNVAEMLHQVIPRQLGVDWFVRPTEEGFEIVVFSLANESETYDGETLPANENQFSIDASEMIDARVSIEQTSSQRFKKLVVQGEPMVCCASFQWEKFERGWKETGVGGEDDYKTALSDLPSDAETNDNIRMGDSFRNVYQRFVVAPNGIDPSVSFPVGFFPGVDESGQVDDTANIPFSMQYRETLDWTPLVSGVDYDSISDFDEALVDPSISAGDDALLPPSAYIDTTFRAGGDQVFAPADRLGIEVAALADTWGLQVTAAPPHLIAGSQFTVSNANPSLVKPLYSFFQMALTFAWQSDQRLQVVTYDDDASELDGTVTIHVPGAELWFVAPGTVYGTNVDGTLKRTPEAYGLVVRDDSQRLHRITAGAKARYQADRYRASIIVNGTAGWNQYLGYLITTINDGTDDTATLKSPITGIQWTFEGQFASTISAGYA